MKNYFIIAIILGCIWLAVLANDVWQDRQRNMMRRAAKNFIEYIKSQWIK
jgi:hypothetical protein